MKTTIIVCALAALMLQGCGSYMGTKMRMEKEIDSVYCPTTMETALAGMAIFGLGPLGTESDVTFLGCGIGVLLLLDVPITATTDTLMLPWDIYILNNPAKGE